MMTTVPLEQAKANFDELVAQLQPGETITLVDAQGQPVVAMTSLQTPLKPEPPSPEEWMAAWEELAKEVSAAWQGEADAVQAIAEMRR